MLLSLIRKAGLVFCLTLLLTACGSSSEPDSSQVSNESNPSNQAIPTKTIVALGDSLTEGYQLPQEESYPSQLQELMNREGYRNYNIVNAGISGDTSLGVLNRKEWIINQSPDVVILTIGANDAFRGFELQETEQNIADTLEAFQANDITVILGGMQITENLGKDYIEAFENLYKTLAKEYETPFIPFFLEGVAGRDDLNLPDRIHPTKEGYKVIVEKNIWPVLKPILDET